MVTIRQDLIPNKIANKVILGTNNRCEYITIHETANTSNGANAAMHAKLQRNGNNRSASWHYQVDDKEAVQSLLDTTSGMHAGDGGNGTGNLHSIGVETCVNADGNFEKTIQNLVELVQELQKRHNIPNDKVVQHNHWSGKDCPRFLRNGNKGITWQDFKNRLAGKSSGSTTVEEDESTEEKVYRVQTGAFRDKKNAEKELKKAKEKLGDAFITEGTQEKTSGFPKEVAGAKLVKEENAYFKSNEKIKVRNKPSTSAKHTGTLPKGESIHYFAVYEGNGYKWLRYHTENGVRYLPYRESGKGNKAWGTFHDERP
ncbi:N-acetylmuramoyl-L-alanine amidase CwlH precursor [Alloiococcus otitis]|uniref:N-acetylmuramoyl-L-alanine amidase n=1 Tax=Alloiococcus otitis ATCC 51267 TaxID=883081 RepID=K9EC27_9LACT|nr:N-acetylmuramoyl-L-alanine amidase [Alloiococcus otitis]EKU93351.1 hypothetical protein HMPREF9698_01099 [Alloiococcus otitis ATCC 51267]SUU81568.1 N-acetylmuramoyl-L-alanine amidase CwlH precursor [Alloiococcus otitis]